MASGCRQASGSIPNASQALQDFAVAPIQRSHSQPMSFSIFAEWRSYQCVITKAIVSAMRIAA